MTASVKKTKCNLPGAGPGRPKGSKNKTTALLKDAILMAADEAHEGGIVGYLKAQANNSPSSFLALLGKVLPVQTEHSGPGGGPIQQEVTSIQRDIVDPKESNSAT
jgi:hypothetical protein